MTGSDADALERDNALVVQALAQWFGDKPCSYEELGHGHINQTWRVRSGDADFVLQKLSATVFSDPRLVAANQTRLFDTAMQTEDFDYLLPQPLPARNGELLIHLPIDALGDSTQDGPNLGYWRLCDYIGNTRTLQSLSNSAQARAAGAAFGRFQRMASGVAPTSLVPVIDGFLQLEGYWRSLRQAFNTHRQRERAGAALDAQNEARRVFVALENLFDDCQAIEGSAVAVIHGDCKVNNLLFAEDADTVSAIVDLDTLMAAPWWLDFGDLVRSAVFSEVGEFQAALYVALAQGYFVGRGSLQRHEIDTVVRAPLHLAFMLSVRFLDDHLRGDRYFRVAEPGDNLRRALAQLNQLTQLRAQQSVMRDALDAILAD